MIGSQFVVPFVPPPRGLVPVERRLAARPSCLHETSHRGHPARTTLLSGYQPPFPGDQAPGGDAAGEGQQAKWCAPQGKMACAAGKMVCATRQNDVRSWQNGVRAISDVTGRPWENDVRVGVRVDVRADGRGACGAAHIIFIGRAIDVYEVLHARSFGDEKGRPMSYDRSHFTFPRVRRPRTARGLLHWRAAWQTDTTALSAQPMSKWNLLLFLSACLSSSFALLEGSDPG